MPSADPVPSVDLVPSVDPVPSADLVPSVDLVVGVGSARGDDAAALLVARRLVAAGVPARVVELTDPTDLLESWLPGDRVVVVDAVRSGAAPGTVHVLDLTHRPLPTGTPAASTHVLGLDVAIELARALGRLPRQLVLYGIEAAADPTTERPSSPVLAAVDTVTAALAAGR